MKAQGNHTDSTQRRPKLGAADEAFVFQGMPK